MATEAREQSQIIPRAVGETSIPIDTHSHIFGNGGRGMQNVPGVAEEWRFDSAKQNYYPASWHFDPERDDYFPPVIESPS